MSDVSPVVAPALVKPRGTQIVTKTITKDDGVNKITTTITTVKSSGVLTLENQEDLWAIMSDEDRKTMEFSAEAIKADDDTKKLDRPLTLKAPKPSDDLMESTQRLIQRKLQQLSVTGNMEEEFSKSPMRSVSRDPPASMPGRSRNARDKSREREMPPKKTHKKAQSSAALMTPAQRKKARHKSMGDGRLAQSSINLRAPSKSKKPGHKRSRSARRDDNKAPSRSNGKSSKYSIWLSKKRKDSGPGVTRSKTLNMKEEAKRDKSPSKFKLGMSQNNTITRSKTLNLREGRKSKENTTKPRRKGSRQDPGKRSTQEKNDDMQKKITRAKTVDFKENKRKDKKLASAKTEMGLSKRAPASKKKEDMIKVTSAPNAGKGSRKKFRLTDADVETDPTSAVDNSSFLFTDHSEQPKRRPLSKKPGLFNNDFFNMEDCRDVPYCEDPLHDRIILDHLGFKRAMAAQQAKSAQTFMDKLNARMDEIREKIKNHDKDMEEQSKMLVAFEKEYQSKRHVVEEYEKAMEEFEVCKDVLSKLDERAYAFLKSMRKPPSVFHHIIAGVKLMLGKKDTRWEDCKRFLLDSNSRNEMLNFDPTTINFDHVLMFSEWMQQNPESFAMKRAERVSPIASLLLRWLLSLINITEQVKRFQKMKGEKAGALEEIEELKLQIRRKKRILKNGDELLDHWKELLSQCLENHGTLKDNLQAANEEIAYFKTQIKNQKIVVKDTPRSV